MQAYFVTVFGMIGRGEGESKSHRSSRSSRFGEQVT